MIGFEEGYEFFTQNVSGIVGVEVGDSYIRTVNSEINNLVDDLNSLEGFSTASKMLKGDVAEFWHSGTFNIDAALKDSKDRAFVDRSHDFASTDISTNYGDRYGLKYKQQVIFRDLWSTKAKAVQEILQVFLKTEELQILNQF